MHCYVVCSVRCTVVWFGMHSLQHLNGARNLYAINAGLELPNFGGTATLALTFVANIGHQGNCQRHQGHTIPYGHGKQVLFSFFLFDYHLDIH